MPKYIRQLSTVCALILSWYCTPGEIYPLETVEGRIFGREDSISTSLLQCFKLFFVGLPVEKYALPVVRRFSYLITVQPRT